MTKRSNDIIELKKDLNFKRVFSNKIFLKDFTNAFFKYIGEDSEYYCYEITPQAFIMADNIKSKSYYGDIVATLSDERILSLEAYSRKFALEEYLKSYAYACRLFSNQKNDKYVNNKRIVSVNLIKGNFGKNNKEIINEYNFINTVTRKEVDNKRIVMYLVRYDLVEKIPYEKGEDRFITYLRLMNAKDIQEMMEYVRGDEIMEEAVKYLKEWTSANATKTFEDYLIENGWKNRWEKRAEARGKKSGLIEGKELGISEEKMNIAKNLLNINMSENVIILATGLTKEELNKLKDSCKC